MRKWLKRFRGNHIIWILLLMVVVYYILGQILGVLLLWPFLKLTKRFSAVFFVLYNYGLFIGDVLILVGYCLLFRKNRFILGAFLPAGRSLPHREAVPEDAYEPTRNNTPQMLLLGLGLGFLMNFFCIACALLHGDIKLDLSFSAAELPVLLFAFFWVFVQSSSEELWCRGFLYERVNIHYPLWATILVNALLFGALHLLNDGISVLAIVDIVLCGFAYSLLRWYTGSLWAVMGLHTMWNFTQNFLFGLPNSGLVSEFSVLHLDAANGTSNLIYDYAFGVEGAFPAILVDASLVILVLLLARRDGRLGELWQSYETRAAAKEE